MKSPGCGVAALLGAALLAAAGPAHAQGYRARIESRMQAVSWRGLDADSIPRSQAVPQANGGFLTPDGHAAACDPDWCHYFRAGGVLRAVPWVTQADVAVWGFGVAGLSARANARVATDLGDATTWPGTEPELQVIEGYLEYARDWLTARAGRQFLTGRLGAYGLDGGRAVARHRDLGLEAAVYGGWGLARGAVLPVTDPALNPLNDFQPRDRQIVFGTELGWTAAIVEARAEYRREVDPAVDYFVSERASASVAVRPVPRLTVAAGGDYDLAFGEVGSADVSATWMDQYFTVTAGGRRYKPFFDLWTIWGAFSPVPYHAWHGSASVTAVPRLALRIRGERYVFEETETFTPTVEVEDRGWRFQSGFTWTPAGEWIVDGGYQSEFGPGASSRGFDGRVTWLPEDRLSVSASAARLRRPLELRYSDVDLLTLGLDAEYRPTPRWRLGLQAASWQEERNRPDAAALDWNQVRVAARVTFLFGTSADRLPLPPAIRSRGTP